MLTSIINRKQLPNTIKRYIYKGNEAKYNITEQNNRCQDWSYALDYN